MPTHDFSKKNIFNKHTFKTLSSECPKPKQTRVYSLLSSIERWAESCIDCGSCRGPTGRKFAAVRNRLVNFKTSSQNCPMSWPSPWPLMGKGHPRQAGSSSTSGAKAKEKKQHTGSTMTPHILRQGKTSCYKEKAEAHRNAAGNHWRWNEG